MIWAQLFEKGSRRNLKSDSVQKSVKGVFPLRSSYFEFLAQTAVHCTSTKYKCNKLTKRNILESSDKYILHSS